MWSPENFLTLALGLGRKLNGFDYVIGLTVGPWSLLFHVQSNIPECVLVPLQMSRTPTTSTPIRLYVALC